MRVAGPVLLHLHLTVESDFTLTRTPAPLMPSSLIVRAHATARACTSISTFISHSPNQSSTAGAGPTGNTIFSMHCMRTFSIGTPMPMAM